MYNLISDYLYSKVGEVFEELTVLFAGIKLNLLGFLLLNDCNGSSHVCTRAREAIQSSTHL